MNNFYNNMNMEQIENSVDNSKMEIGNMLQLQLAAMHNEDIELFIENHAEAFRVLMNATPSFYEDYQNDPDGTLIKISKQIYH